LEQIKTLIITAIFVAALSSFALEKETTMASITVSVSHLNNSTGIVQFSLYNTQKSIPDEHFKKYFLQLKAEINSKTATVVFKDIPEGKYAINVFHDENKNGVIDKGWVLPVEGLGFSNMTALNILNRPNYNKAKFELKKDTAIVVKMIYM